VPVGVKPPQLLPVACAQVADHITPWFVVSFCNVAMIDAVVPTGIEDGGALEIVTESVGFVMVVMAVAIAGLSTDVAVIVTGKPPVGTVVGAV
jgi:hypothetical protein